MNSPLPRSSSEILNVADVAVGSFLRKWPSARRWRSDLKQEAVVAVLEAKLEWNGAFGVPFAAYASPRVGWRLLRFLERFEGPVRSPKWRRPGSNASPVRSVELPLTLTSPVESPSVVAMLRLGLAALLRAVRNELAASFPRRKARTNASADQRDLSLFLRTRVLGEEVKSVAISLGLSRKRAYDVLLRFRQMSALRALIS